MKPRSKWKKEILASPYLLLFYFNFLTSVFCSSIILASSEEISRPKRQLGYREPRRVENDDLLKLSKVLRSVDEEDEPAVKSIETALQSIEEENNLHESKKKSRIAKVLEDIEDHTKKALSNTTSPKRSQIPHLWPDQRPKRNEGGRTVTIDTVQGKKKVFIPKGWIFCTISPVICYSGKTNKNRKREVTKRNIQNHVTKDKLKTLKLLQKNSTKQQ